MCIKNGEQFICQTLSKKQRQATKKAHERHQNLTKKSKNMVVSDIKISPNIKSKDWLSIVKIALKSGTTLHRSRINF